jgi:hypothetical protein
VEGTVHNYSPRYQQVRHIQTAYTAHQHIHHMQHIQRIQHIPNYASIRPFVHSLSTGSIDSFIIKMSEVSKASRVFRGLAGGALPPKFLQENEYRVRRD